MKEIIEKITQWAEDRNLINGSTPTKQGLKLMSEVVLKAIKELENE